MRGVAAAVLTLLVALACAGSAAAESRFSLAGGCYALRAQAPGALVAKAAAGSWSASAADVAGAERFRMQATALGQYLLYGVRRGRVRFVAVTSKQVASSRKRLRARLRLAGLR